MPWFMAVSETSPLFAAVDVWAKSIFCRQSPGFSGLQIQSQCRGQRACDSPMCITGSLYIGVQCTFLTQANKGLRSGFRSHTAAG